jgi:Tol biopolymer transport system component
MMTSDGFVKILDFGLAKLMPFAAAAEDRTLSVNVPATSAGVVLGTVGYMSPEQAAGTAVDFRTDQFSFGVLLYEMASGRRAFSGPTPIDTLSAILHDEPEQLAVSNPQLPAPLRWTIERCLAKNPEERFGSTRDLARDLAVLRDHLSEVTTGAPFLAKPKPRRRWLQAAAAACVGLALLAAGLALGRARKHPLPTFKRLTFQRGTVFEARFAPDGQTILYDASWGGPREIYSARPESTESRPLGLPGGVDALFSVSSSAQLAVRVHSSDGKRTMAQVPLTGGAPRELLENVRAACWAPDGKSLAAVVSTRDEHTDEGTSRIEFPLGKLLTTTGDAVFSIRVSPDGRRLAVMTRGGTSTGHSIEVVEQDGTRRALSTDWPFAVAGGLSWSPDGREIWFAGDRDGGTSALHAVSLDGKERLVARFPVDMVLHDISREGRVLLARETRRNSVSVLVPGERAEKDLSWLDSSGVSGLSADGRTVAIVEFGQGGGSTYATYLRKSDGSPAVRMTDGAAWMSPDGNWLASMIRSQKLVRMLVPVGPGSARPLEGSFSAVSWCSWFPDSRRILVTARESGRGTRVYVQDVMQGAPRPITPEGFALPWGSDAVSPDGSTLVALDPDQRTVLVPSIGGTPRPVPGLKGSESPIKWTADGRSLLVFAQELPARVFRLDLETARRSLWKEISPPDTAGVQIINAFKITPDELGYAYSYDRRLSDLYLVEGLE